MWAAVNLPKVIGFFMAFLPVYLLVQPEGFGIIIPIIVGLGGGLAVILFSLVMLLGILNQYGLISIFKPINRFVLKNLVADRDLNFELREQGSDAFLLYAMKKSELESPSLGYLRWHAFSSWLLSFVALILAPSLIYFSFTMQKYFKPSIVSGWMTLKGVLCIFLAVYFGIAFFQGIRGLNQDAIPGWTIRITFAGGVFLGFSWLLCGITPMAQGRFGVDVFLAVSILLPLYLQYRKDRDSGLDTHRQLPSEQREVSCLPCF